MLQAAAHSSVSREQAGQHEESVSAFARRARERYRPSSACSNCPQRTRSESAQQVEVGNLFPTVAKRPPPAKRESKES